MNEPETDAQLVRAVLGWDNRDMDPDYEPAFAALGRILAELAQVKAERDKANENLDMLIEAYNALAQPRETETA